LVKRCLVGCADYLDVQLGDLENFESTLPTQAHFIYLDASKPSRALG
jgi:hypothetical protein